jgi:hypothetical protein
MDTESGVMVMAKRAGRPKTSERDDVSIKIDRALVSKARLLAAHKGVSIAELISELLRGPLNQDYAKMLRELEKGGGK